MKLLMLLGGVLGFAIGFISSSSRENSWPYCLWHASLAAYVGGWLMGWWGRVWQQNLKNAAQEQELRAAAAAMSAPSTPKTSKS
jgi:membrane protein DedA with SNARE-associated domain